MRIGFAAPINPCAFSDYLPEWTKSLPRGLGGTPTTALALEFLKKGNHVSAYTLSPDVQEPTLIESARLKVYVGGYRNSHRMHDFMRLERCAISNFVTLDQPDIVHAHWTYEFALGALNAPAPCVVTVHDWAPTILRLNPDMYRVGRLIMNVSAIRQAKYLTVVSPHIGCRLRRWSTKTTPLIPNGIDDHAFIFDNRDLNRTEPVILSINNGFSRLKNVQSLILAFDIIRKHLPHARLRLIGYDYQVGGPAELWAVAHSSCQGIEFVGALTHEEILNEVGQADLLIHPSLEESFGMTLIEAMARRTPVIGGYKSGAVPWVLGDGRAGVLVDVSKPTSIADAAILILSDDAKWNQSSRVGQEHAWENFRLSHVANMYMELYQSILHQNIV